MPDFHFMEDVNKPRRIFLSLWIWTLFLGIQLRESSPARDEVRVRIIATGKSNRFWLVKQQLGPRIMLFCTFPCRRCTTTTWKCLISRFIEDVNTWDNNFPFLFLNFDTVFRIQLRNIYQHSTNLMSWNKRVKVWGRANSLFKWRFCNRQRRYCLSSLIFYLSFPPTFNCNNKSMCHCRSISTYILPSIFYRGVSYVKSCVFCQYPCSSYRWFTVLARPFVFTIKAILRAVENEFFVLSDS